MAYIRKTKDIHISPKLLTILEKISNKSTLAKQLLKTKISKDILVDNPIDYLSVSKEDPNKISYAYPEKLAKISPDDYWHFKGRVHAKPAVALKKILKNTTEKELDLFTSLYKAAVAHRDFIFQVVSGEDIRKYYLYNSYKRNVESSGSLGLSCMKYDYCQTFFEIYEKNPEVCQMLVMLDINDYSLMGRSLLWEATDEKGKTVKVMDRIYCVDDNKNVHYFKEWADDNNYISRKSQRWFDCLSFESFGKTFQLKLLVKIKNDLYVKFPYIDTFKFYDEQNQIIYNFLPENNKDIKTLIASGVNGGYFDANSLALDDYHGIYYHKDKIYIIPYEIDGVKNRNIALEFLYWSDTLKVWIFRQYSVFNEELNDYIFYDKLNHLNDNSLIEERKKTRLEKSKKTYEIEPNISYTEYEVTLDDVEVPNLFDDEDTIGVVQNPPAPFDDSDLIRVDAIQPTARGQIASFLTNLENVIIELTNELTNF